MESRVKGQLTPEVAIGGSFGLPGVNSPCALVVLSALTDETGALLGVYSEWPEIFDPPDCMSLDSMFAVVRCSRFSMKFRTSDT